MAIIIAVCMMFGVPVKYYMMQKRQLVNNYVNTEVRYITDNIRNTGIISAAKYRQFREKVYCASPGSRIYIECEKDRDDYMEYYYTTQIEEELDKRDKCMFNTGNFIRVRVVDADNMLIAYYGGMVKDENY